MIFDAKKEQAKILRLKGNTYREINNILKTSIPKSTLSYWFKDLVVPPDILRKIQLREVENLERGRQIASFNKLVRKAELKKRIMHENTELIELFARSKSVRKIALVMLYMAEGSKTNRASIMFGNSSPHITCLFLVLLRSCFRIDEKKFRVTVQCRADQNVANLEKFWSHLTYIPLSKFYKAQVDKRTKNKPSRKKDYKGVCRIDYFSAEIDFELKLLAELVGKK